MADVVENLNPPTADRASDVPALSPLGDLARGPAGVLVLLVLVFICYAWSSQFGYIWDDDAYVTNNSALRSFAGLSRIWTEIGATPQYYPVTFTSFWMEMQIAGARPGVSHVINFLLHGASALLLLQVLRRLAVPGAWVAAAVWAVHPIQVESVAWISERKNTLSLLLALSSLWVYLRYAAIGLADEPAPPGEGFHVPLPNDPKRLYRLFLILFTLALLAKTTVSVLPGVILMIVWWQRGRITKQDIVPLLPAFVLGLAGAALTSHIEHDPFLVGATGPDWDIPLVQRVMLVGQTAAFYASKILVPVGFSFNYARWTLDAKNAVQWLPLAGVVAVVAGLFAARRSIGRGPLAGVLIFLGCLLPACGLFMFFPMRFSWVADHFAYAASIGLISVVVAALATLLSRIPTPAAALGGIALVPLTVLTISHSLAFRDLKTLWSTTWQQNRKSWLAAMNYGVWSMDEANRQYAERVNGGNDQALPMRDKLRVAAEAWVRAGLQIKPDSFEGYNTLGTLYRQKGDIDGAIANYRRAAELVVQQGAIGHQLPNFQLGELLAEKGDVAGARAVFDALEKLQPKLAPHTPGLYGRMYTERGDLYRLEMKSPPGLAMPKGDVELLGSAIEEYNHATEVAPEFLPPKLKLAEIMIAIQKLDEALRQIHDVLQIDRNNTAAKMLAASVAQSQGQYEVAVLQLQNLLLNDAGYLPAHLELAKSYMAMNHRDEAVNELQATLRAMPDATPAKDLLAQIESAATQPATQPGK